MLLRTEPQYSMRPRIGLQEGMGELAAAIDLADRNERKAIANQIKGIDSPFLPGDLVWLSQHSDVINHFLETDETLNKEWRLRLKALNNPSVPLVSLEGNGDISVFTQYKAAYFWNCYKYHRAQGKADSTEAQSLLNVACELDSFYALIGKLNFLKMRFEQSTATPELIKTFTHHVRELADKYWTVGLMAAGLYWMAIADYYRDHQDGAHCAEAFESAAKSFLLGSCLEAHPDSAFLASVYYPENGWLDIFKMHPVFSGWRSSEDVKKYLEEVISNYMINDAEFLNTCLKNAEKKAGEIYGRFPQASSPEIKS